MTIPSGNSRGDAATAGDLAAAVLEVVRRVRADPARIAARAAAEGVSADVVEAALLVNAFAEWLAHAPGAASPPARPADRDAWRADALRAGLAAASGGGVAVGLRLPPGLLTRVIELAALCGVSTEEAILRVLGDHVDEAMADECGRRGRTAPRRWSGGRG